MLGAASGAAATLAVHRSQQAQSGSPSPPQGGQAATLLPQPPTVVHVETSSGTRGGTTALVGGAVLVGGV